MVDIKLKRTKYINSALDQCKIWSAKCIQKTNCKQVISIASKQNEKWDMLLCQTFVPCSAHMQILLSLNCMSTAFTYIMKNPFKSLPSLGWEKSGLQSRFIHSVPNLDDKL